MWVRKGLSYQEHKDQSSSKAPSETIDPLQNKKNEEIEDV
jgi:hypothetical protein